MGKNEIKHYFVHSPEGHNPCSLRREPFLPDLTVKGPCKTLIRPLVQQLTARKSTERALQRAHIDWATVYLRIQQLGQE